MEGEGRTKGKGQDRRGASLDLLWIRNPAKSAGLCVLSATALGRWSCMMGAARISQASTWQETGPRSRSHRLC